MSWPQKAAFTVVLVVLSIVAIPEWIVMWVRREREEARRDA
jgi:hypothetical protein